MPIRRANDAQVERLLQALHSLPYRQDLARRISQQENIAYSSAMRRLQRYITEAGERRTFTRAPKAKVKIMRAAARQVPRDLRPTDVKITRYEPPVIESPGRPSFYKEIEPAEIPEDYIPYSERESLRDINQYDYWAVVAYHDGDAKEAAQTLDLSPRGENLLRTATTGDGVAIQGAAGSGEVDDAIRDFYADADDAQDVEDFYDLVNNMPDWNIGIMMEDIRSGGTTFSDWLDRWHEDHMIYREWGKYDASDLEDSEFWELWRAAYARATA